MVVAVSGGPDSMALLDYLAHRRQTWSLTLVVASVDHGLRAGQSVADLRFVEHCCKQRNLLFAGTHVGAAAYAKQHHLSIEAAARACRYRFFAAVMREHNANKLALAHHGDEQMETMLMRQVRGSFGEARAGIPVRRPFAGGEIIRPFLGVDKAQIEAYCHKQGITPRRDPSNESDDYTRNRFRHHILPFLKKENPNVHLRFQQDSQMLRDDHRYLEQLAKERLNEVTLSQQSDSFGLSVPAFLAMPKALQTRMIRLVLNYLYGQIPPSVSSIHIEDLLDLLRGDKPSAQLDFPAGLRVIRSYDILQFTYRQKGNGTYAYRHGLQVPGETVLPAGVLCAEIQKINQNDPYDGDEFVCDADLVHFPLAVRTKQAGDRLRPKGMKGSKKVKDIFIEQKVCRQRRACWPVITDADEQILWVPDLKHSDYAAVSKETRRLLILRLDWVSAERAFRT